MHARSSHLARRFALLVAFVVAVASLSNPLATAAGARTDGADRTLLGLAMDIAGPAMTSYDRLTGAEALTTGSDGRLTILGLGSDSRGTAVSRTDTILIASVKNGQISMASIPRDTGRIPNPFGGGLFRGKVNGIVRSLMMAGNSREEALRKFVIVIEELLKIEIDYYAVLWFGGLTTLVGRVDPITVTIPTEIRDPKQVDDPPEEWGVYFPKANSYSLYDYNPTGDPYCDGRYKFDTDPPIDTVHHCHRALPFVRSRKGPNNNDWVRARRQQNFAFAAIRAITSQAELEGLYSTARFPGAGKWITNMPLTLANAQDLYNRVRNASFAHQVVFKPNTYATRIVGTSAWELKLSAVRSWTAAYMR